MGVLIFILGLGIGFLVMNMLAGKKEGMKPRLILKMKRYDYHLHHWLVASIIMVFLFLIGYNNDFVYGLLVGVIFQGLTYKDFYEIRTKNKK